MYRLQAAWPVAQLVGAGACDPLAERVAVRADELDGCARVEAALAADDPDAEQARPALDERAAGALVDVQTPCDRLAEAQPELERGIAAVPRREAGGGCLTGEDRPEHVLAVAGCDHRWYPGCAGHLRREHLAAHSPTPQLGAGAELCLDGQRAFEEQLCPRRARCAGVDALD